MIGIRRYEGKSPTRVNPNESIIIHVGYFRVELASHLWENDQILSTGYGKTYPGSR